MAKQDFHSQLSTVLHRSHLAMMNFMNALSQAERSAPGTWENWAAKDQLAHVTYWNRRGVEFLSYVFRGQEPPKYPHYEECNRLNFDETKDKPVEMIMRDAKAVQGSLELVLKRFTEEDLRTPGKNPNNKEGALLEYVLHSYYSHVITHVADAYLKLGDTQAVDRVADQMVTDILSLDDSPRSRGTVLYNRACLYALSGNKTQAFEYLERGITHRPDLKQWAKEDSDLVSLRDEPKFTSLLAE